MFKPKPIQNADIAHAIETDLAKIEAQKSFVKAQLCPQCKQKEKLRLTSYQLGLKGNTWEAKIICDNCKSVGILNDTGFHFEYAYANLQGEQTKK